MSVQFGIWNYDRKPVDVGILDEADSILSPYAPDGRSRFSRNEIAVVHYALHATAESRHEKQPYLSQSGNVVFWDGRLDNRDELARELQLPRSFTDVELVGAAFDDWKTDCFAKLVGDWAMCIWSEREQVLILARDLMGIRPLYYFVEGSQVRWSSILAPLVSLARRQFELNYDYVAGWLAMYPAADATPYVGIHAVPPCSFVALTPERQRIVKYWDFNPCKRINYRTDADYEEHFRSVFRQAVERRLRSHRTICAELSGGMDSPSITCMADLIASSSPDIPPIETLSYFDDSEPHANERPYFEKVEEKRGRRGCHISVGGRKKFDYDMKASLQPTPSNIVWLSNEEDSAQISFLKRNEIRVVLSGLGGDEVMGGVPTPQPELQDLLVRGQLEGLASKLKSWALYQRKPWFYLLRDAIQGFLPLDLLPAPKYRRPVQWLDRSFVKQHKDVLAGFEERILFFGPLPSFHINLKALCMLQRQLATKCLSKEPAHEERYPFLDRDLLEFVYAIPREQLIRPGFRRSLMRRSLTGIVPAEILERRRKAYASRGPRIAVRNELDSIAQITKDMETARFGIVNEQLFQEAVTKVQTSDEVPLVRFIRTLLVEVWLRNVMRHGVISYGPANTVPQDVASAMTTLGADIHRLPRNGQL